MKTFEATGFIRFKPNLTGDNPEPDLPTIIIMYYMSKGMTVKQAATYGAKYMKEWLNHVASTKTQK